MLEHLLAIISGAIFVIAVIAGIGPQNLNTISHAIRRNHEYAVATTCFIADSALILAGCIGLSLSNSEIIILLINIIGILFMTWYLFSKVKGVFAKRSNYKINSDYYTKNQAILRALALTWLNPLVFIDTIVVIGGTAMQYAGIQRTDFIIGAIVGDMIWLYGLTFLAKTFSTKLNRRIVWIILDIVTIIIISIILFKTVIYLYGKV